MQVEWVGAATIRLDIGSFRILTDPAFSEGPEAFIMNGHPSTGEDNVRIARFCPVPPVDLDGLDLVIATHLHSDHFDSAAVAQLDRRLQVVAPTPNVARLREWGFGRVDGLGWGDERVWQRNGERLRVVAWPAHHSHDAQVDHELGVVNGYLIELVTAESIERLYWTGDTVWFDQLADIAADAPRLDLLLPHLGAVGRDGPWGLMTLDAVEGVRVIRAFAPDTVIPIHHSTFSHYVEPISVFRERLSRSDFQGQLVIPHEGESWVGGSDQSAGRAARREPSRAGGRSTGYMSHHRRRDPGA